MQMQIWFPGRLLTYTLISLFFRGCVSGNSTGGSLGKQKMIMHALIRKYMAALLNCLAAVCLISLFSILCPAQAMDMNPVPEPVSKIFIQRGQEQISVFTLVTAAGGKAMQKGFSKSAPIPDDYGMLFILDKTSEHFFWMKGMEFGINS